MGRGTSLERGLTENPRPTQPTANSQEEVQGHRHSSSRRRKVCVPPDILPTAYRKLSAVERCPNFLDRERERARERSDGARTKRRLFYTYGQQKGIIKRAHRSPTAPSSVHPTTTHFKKKTFFVLCYAKRHTHFLIAVKQLLRTTYTHTRAGRRLESVCGIPIKKLQKVSVKGEYRERG